MVTDVDRLRIIYELDDKLAAAGFRRVETASRRAGAAIRGDFSAAEGAVGSLNGAFANTNNMRQFGFQVSQLGQKAAATDNFLQALSIQIPDIAMIFGGAGMAMAGAGAAMAIALIPEIIKASTESKSLKDRLAELEASTDAMSEAATVAATPIEELREKYGDLANEVQRANVAMAGLLAISARRDALGAAKMIGDSFGDLTPQSAPVGWDGSVNPDRQRLAMAEVSKAMDALRRKTGATAEQAEILRMALNRIGSSNSLEAVVRDGENLLEVITDLYRGATDEQRTYLDGLAGQINGVIQAATKQIEAAAEDGVRASARLLDQYDADTRRLSALAKDREAAEGLLTQAVKDGNQEKIDSYTRVLRAIDAEVSQVQIALSKMDGAFEESVARIKGLAGEIGGAISGAMKGALGFDFADFGKQAAAAQKGILDLIKSVESGGDYNVTLDHGAYTNGPRDLVNMTINEVLEMQRQMLAHPGNKKNSSAAGAYQIVRKTLLGLMQDLGLSGDELYSVDMQDRLAMELIRRRRGQGVAGLRNDWPGLIQATFPHLCKLRQAQFWLHGQNLDAQEAVSGDVQPVHTARGHWRGTIEVVLKGEAAVLEWQAFVAQMAGMAGTTLVPFASRYRPLDRDGHGIALRGVAGLADAQTWENFGFAAEPVATMGVETSAPLRATQLRLTKNNTTGIRPGQYFSIGDRAYQVRSHWLTDDGVTNVLIFPPLRGAAAVGAVAILDRPVCRMRFATPDEGRVETFYSRLPIATINLIEAQ